VKKELIKGPVGASISASSPTFKFYAMGIIDDLALFGQSHMACSTGKINHAVTIVGWGREENFEKDYFIIKNSFGTDWGQ
jgi:C1A family cysteine protease